MKTLEEISTPENEDEDEDEFYPDEPDSPSDLPIEVWKREADRHRKAGYRYKAMLDIYRMRLFGNRDEAMHILDTKWAEMTEPQRGEAMRIIRDVTARQARTLSDEVNAVLQAHGIPRCMQIHVYLENLDYKPLFR